MYGIVLMAALAQTPGQWQTYYPSQPCQPTYCCGRFFQRFRERERGFGGGGGGFQFGGGGGGWGWGGSINFSGGFGGGGFQFGGGDSINFGGGYGGGGFAPAPQPLPQDIGIGLGISPGWNGGGGFGPGWGGGGWNGGGGIGLGNLNAGQQIITLPPPPIILQQRTPDIFSPFPGFGGFGGLQVLPINGGGFFGAQQFGGGGCPNCGPQIRPAQGLQAASGRPPAGYINLTSYWKRW